MNGDKPQDKAPPVRYYSPAGRVVRATVFWNPMARGTRASLRDYHPDDLLDEFAALEAAHPKAAAAFRRNLDRRDTQRQRLFAVRLRNEAAGLRVNATMLREPDLGLFAVRHERAADEIDEIVSQRSGRASRSEPEPF